VGNMCMIFFLLFCAVCSFVVVGRSPSASANTKSGLARSIVLSVALLVTAGFRFAIYYMQEGAPFLNQYFIPGWALDLDRIVVHLVQTLCLLLIAVMASRQFVRKSTMDSWRKSESLGAKLLGNETDETDEADSGDRQSRVSKSVPLAYQI
jgi:membrane protein implicated in regulation of membrane protease activity